MVTTLAHFRPTDGQFRRAIRRAARARGHVYRALFPNTFAPRTRIGARLILENPGQIRVGEAVIVSHGCMLACAPPTSTSHPSITIGAKTFLNMGSVVASSMSGIRIGEDVLFGPHTLVVDSDHCFASSDLAVARQGMTDRGPIAIGDGAWVATGAVILGGTTIAAGSVVAANSVVRGHFPHRCLLAGAPARIVRELD